MESESAASEPSRTGALSWPDFLPFSLYPDSPGIYGQRPQPQQGAKGQKALERHSSVEKQRGKGVI